MASELYEPLIERDFRAFPAAVRKFRDEHSSEDLFLAIARFAILAYAPSLHSSHAVLAVLSAYELRDTFADRWDDLLIECARYAAESRQPWSEPPILDPPHVDNDEPRDINALRRAVRERDRLAGERWLAARIDDAGHDLLTAASDDFDDLGVKFIITDAAIKLSRILGEKGRYATLRVAMWEIVASSAASERSALPRAEAGGYTEALVDNAVAEEGSIESVHALFLHEAAKDTHVFDRVCAYIASLELKKPERELPKSADLPIYQLARDYGQHLRAWAMGNERLKSATQYNLDHGESLANWSFA